MNMTFNPSMAVAISYKPDGLSKTFKDAAESYLKRKPAQRKYLEKIIPHIGDMSLHEIAPITVRDLAEQLYPNNKNSTKNRCVLAPVRSVFYHGYDHLWCHPLRIKGFPEEKKPDRPFATFEWMVLFLRQCAIDQLPHLAALALFINRTGARISEALRVTWEDVDLFGRTALLRKTKTGKNSVRHMTDDLIRLMGKLVMKPGERIFSYICRHSVNERIKAVCRRAKIRYLPTHAIGRRAFAKNAIAAGVDVKSAMVAGGWESSKVFLEVYVQSPHGGRRVAEKFNLQQYDLEAC